ncbi:MAG: zinc-binding alcohol dehydrogenase [Defluviicoccus sp.]|nr:zinc-binding alcohol dehydrogenase [Defluviicoccus sp.]MDG4591446.1 zinc-binding alcohol dehydrogenase [Defluviicoccus sp.]MDS4072921.1 zinc-binding alcohol dehydrogenase [Defluviicoccus sp.]
MPAPPESPPMPPLTARAFWVTGPEQADIREQPLPLHSGDELLVRALCSGISRGTEVLVYRNRVPVSEYARMRCPFQEGAFPAPVKYGYAWVGAVQEGPERLRGTTVFVLHPHQDWAVVPAAAALPVPGAVPPSRAILAANMETALNTLWDGQVQAGDRVCVLGAGVVGLMLAHLASRIPAVRCLIVDPDAGKEAAAAGLGLTFCTAPPADLFDVVFHASGNPAGLATALALADFEATVIEASWYGVTPVTLPLGEGFHAKRLTLRSSQVGAVSPRQRARLSHRQRLEMALALLADDRLDGLITGESAFAELPQVMARLADGSLPALCHRIRY